MRLRGYIVSDPWPEDGSASLVFHHTAREARNLGAEHVMDLCGCDFMMVRAVWARSADPEAWGVTEPCVMDPDGCKRCEMWYAEGPVDPDTKLCGECREESRDAA